MNPRWTTPRQPAPNLARLLGEAGWEVSRNADVSADLGALHAEGYEVWDALRAFLQAWSGITIAVVRDGRPDWIWINAERATTEIYAERVRDYIRESGEPLVPVGYAHFEHLAVLLGRSGSLYGGYDDFFELLGRDMIEALEVLVSR